MCHPELSRRVDTAIIQASTVLSLTLIYYSLRVFSVPMYYG